MADATPRTPRVTGPYRVQPRQLVTAFLAGSGADTLWDSVFLFLAAGLASTIVLKIAGIQYMELLYMLQMVILLYRFQRGGFRLTMLRPLRWLALLYAAFIVGALVLSLHALSYQFYFFGAEPQLIRRPFIITISRCVELLGNSTMLIYLAESFRRSRAKLRFTMRVYFWVGMASVGFAIVSVPIYHLTYLQYGVLNSGNVRMRGFLNEGGPFGLYVINLYLVGYALMVQGWETRRRMYACFALITIALLGSSSKAALACCLVYLFINALMAGSPRQQIGVLAAIVLVVAIAVRFVDVPRQLRTYQQTTRLYEQASLFHRGDANFVEGRVAGAFIVPRMIAAHPWTGIGWGNYGYLRNSPEYRGASAWSDYADDPGLGIYGSTADFGIPLQMLMLAALFLPFFLLRARRAPTYLANLALLQPLSHLFGAQLNITHVWVVTAFALGLAYANRANVVDPYNARAEDPPRPRHDLVVA